MKHLTLFATLALGLAACGSTEPAPDAMGAESAVATSALPEIRYFMIADA